MNKNLIKTVMFILIAPFCYLLLFIASFFPKVIETYYSSGFFKVTNQSLSLFTGIFPFSIAEILIILLPLLCLLWLIICIRDILIKKQTRAQILLRFFVVPLIVFTLTYSFFVLFWGLNYARLPFSQIANFDTKPTDKYELKLLCEILLAHANTLRNSVSEDNMGAMKLSTSKSAALKEADHGYDIASKTFPELGGKFGRPKGIILSELMSYLGICGFYFPFTGESNLNLHAPDVTLPHSICHEMAHQRGFSREDEANFVGYIACIKNTRSDFQYSGYYTALSYAMSALYDEDTTMYGSILTQLDNKVIIDRASSSKYWRKYEGKVSNVSSSVNNTYLKANLQNDGVKSYGRMVDLLIAEMRKDTVK